MGLAYLSRKLSKPFEGKKTIRIRGKRKKSLLIDKISRNPPHVLKHIQTPLDVNFFVDLVILSW